MFFQRLINTRRFQFGAQQHRQQIGNHDGKYRIDAAGNHLGSRGNDCRGKDAAAQAQYDNALANREEPVAHCAADGGDPVAGFIFAGCTACVGGAVMTREYADMIGADFYGKDALETVRFAQEFFGS